MATEDGPPAKKQKLTVDIVSTAAQLRDVPTKHSVVYLYNPEMVKVTVSNEAVLDPPKMAFTVPKALICNRSEYFEKLFKRDFVEGKALLVELHDVDARIFQCFIGWLYCHQIFVDDLDEPTIERSAAKPCENRMETQKDSSDTGQGDVPANAAEMLDAGGVNQQDGGNASIFGSTTTADADDGHPLDKPASTVRTAAKLSNAKRFAGDPDDPLTWSWSALFALYIFADKYSTRKLRIEVLLIIHTKLFIKETPEFKRPSRKGLKWAAENLPPSSPLFRLLADWCGLRRPPRPVAMDPTDQANDFYELPASFLSASLVALKRYALALECSECRAGVTHSNARAHTSDDRKPMDERDLCGNHHEHGDDKEEAARCALQWESRKSLFTASAVRG